MNDSKTTPTAGQMTNAGFMIATAVVKTLESSNITSGQLKNFKQEDANTIASKIIRDHFSLIEQRWFKEKKKNSLFWKKFFNIEIDWSEITIPPLDGKFKRIEFCPKNVTRDELFKKYAETFGKDQIWKYCESIDKTVKSEQIRPVKEYVFGHVGEIEPDKEHLNKSYNDAMKEGFMFMVAKEGLIAAFRYRFETKEMLDVKCVTQFATLESDGNIMDMCRNEQGKFHVDRYGPNYREPRNGQREVSF